jgi:protein O-GlcNAc transferase
VTDPTQQSKAARDAQHKKARALAQQSKFTEAVAAYEKLIATSPDFGSAYFELAGILDQHLQRADLAVAQLEIALVRAPRDAGRVCNSLGVFALRRRDIEAAVGFFERAIEADPSLADPYANLGLIHYDRNSMERALENFAQAVERAPDLPALLHNYTLVLSKAGRGDEAIRVGKRAMKLDPNNATGWHNLGLAHRNRGQLDEALRALQKSVSLPGHTAVFHSDLLMISLYDSNRSLQKLVLDHRAWARCHAPKPAYTFAPRPKGRRLKIGYVSADFGVHPVGHFLAPVVSAHDRTRFEIFAYSSTLNEDVLTRHFEAHCDHFERVGTLSDAQLAELVHRDGIDILFDLSGHTAHNRLITFALKPAPTQISWLGYPFTTGLETIDYFISDRFETPEGFDAWFTEKLIRMPNGYLCVQAPPYAPPVNPLPALSDPVFTFGCFNNLSKVRPEVIALWSEILKETQPSRLFLHTRELEDPATQANIVRLFAQHGISSDRLKLMGAATPDQLIARYGSVDLALDPFPYCGGLTTCEAMWMGVPVVTLPSDRFCGRHTLTHASNAGIPMFAADSKDTYRAIARRWREDLPGLSALRGSLREQMRASPLVDAARFTRDLETVLARLVAEQ